MVYVYIDYSYGEGRKLLGNKTPICSRYLYLFVCVCMILFTMLFDVIPQPFQAALPTSFTGLDYSTLDQQQQQHHEQFMKPPPTNSHGMVDYMLSNHPQHQQQLTNSGFCTSSFDKLSFGDVMQFSDFGPKLALNQTRVCEEETGIIDPVYFLKFPVLNDKSQDHDSLLVPQPELEEGEERYGEARVLEEIGEGEDEEENTSVQLQFLGENLLQKNTVMDTKNKRKRPRTIKTSEEVESQRMTHIAVERNRRKQMNEHLRVLRSLMPSSYVQRVRGKKGKNV